MQLFNYPVYPSSLSIKPVIEKLESNETTGLTNEEAVLRIKQFGENSIEAKKRRHLFFELLSHFKNSLILILIVATIISYSLGETINASIILFMILISVAINFYQEQDARNEAEQLKQSVKSKAVVIRNGKQEEIFHEELWVGDIILLSAGKIVPADAGYCLLKIYLLINLPSPVNHSLAKSIVMPLVVRYRI
jgi:magnesium-transporting ATPase (P-type)